MTSTQLAFQNNKINNTHSFYSPSLEEYIQVNDDVFNDIRRLKKLNFEHLNCSRVFQTSILGSLKTNKLEIGRQVQGRKPEGRAPEARSSPNL